MSMQIRQYRTDDEAQVTALWDAVFQDDAPHNAPGAVITQKLAYQPELFFVGTLDDKIIGTILAGYDGHRGWLYAVATSPNQRRQGYGTQLIRHAESALADMGCTKVNLQVRESNAEVAAFYRVLGYAVEDRTSLGKRFTSTVNQH